MTETRLPRDFPERSGRRRVLRASYWFLVVLGAIALAGAIAVSQMVERAIAAPDWLRDRLEARIEALVPGVDVSMGEIAIQMSRDFSPRVSVDALQLNERETARPLLSLTRLDAELSRAAALRGQVAAKRVSAAGLFMTLRRSSDGAFDLRLGDGLGATAPDLATLLRQIDDTAENPQLAGLEVLTLEAVTLDYQDALSGRAWLIDGGQILGNRSADAISLRADFALLSGGADVTTVVLNATSPIGQPNVQIGLTLEGMPAADIAAQSAALSWLGVLRAPISGALRTGFDTDGALLPLNATLQIGEGVLQPTDVTRPIPFQSARAYFTFNAAEQSFAFSEVSVASEWVTASGTGQATLTNDEAGAIAGLTAQLSLSGVSANPFDIYDAPRELQAATVDLGLDIDPFNLRIGQIALRSDETQVLADARIKAEAKGWHVSAQARATQMEHDDVLRFWPEDIVPGTRRWVADNVQDGTFRNLQFVLRQSPDTERPHLYLGTEIENGTVRFLKSMPVLTDITGRLTLEDNALTIVADKAKTRPATGGAIVADGTTFLIEDVRARPSQAEVKLRTTSTVTAALSMIDNAPLEVMTRAGRPVDIADGRAQLIGVLSFPLQRKIGPADVAYTVEGQIRDMRSESIVPGRVLSSPELDIDVTSERVRLSGAGTLDGVRFRGTWRSPLTGPREARAGLIEADVEISERTLDAFNVALPPGSFSGAGQGQLVIDLPQGAGGSFSLSSNLDGIGLRLDPIGWGISRGTKGRFAVSGALGRPVRIDRLSLDAPGLNGSGRLRLDSSGRMQALEVDRLRVGGWLDAPVTLRGRPLQVAISGGSADLRRAPFGAASGGGSGTGAAGPLALALDRLQVSDTLALTSFRGNFSSVSPLVGDFMGRLNGGQQIQGRARAMERGTGFVIRAEDGGEALKDAGIFRTLNDGDLTLRLTPTGSPGTFDGELTMNGPRLRRAPAIAELLNAVSIVGLLTQLNGEGIYFDEIEARFRLTPSQVRLTQGSAVGPSMGISLDGLYDIARQRIDMQGVVSPLYALNILGRPIARKGEGLIGFNFSMRGDANAPVVSVNPLSALTPGMFRDIFRRPAPTLSE